jgi:hypothetical protein
MRHDFEPLLDPVALASLRPTQMTVGLREVARKRQGWRARAKRDGPAFLGRHMIPVVLGPGPRPFVLDNHHLALALRQEGVEHVLVKIVVDLSGLEKPAFWTFMDSRNWLHPFDSEGARRSRARLPKGLDDLVDDPYRSLAGEVRRAGGYAKDETAYSEFLWGDFLRRRIAAKALAQDFDGAVIEALAHCHRPEASYLPGWCGAHEALARPASRPQAKAD